MQVCLRLNMRTVVSVPELWFNSVKNKKQKDLKNGSKLRRFPPQKNS